MSARRGSARGKPAPQLEQVVVSLNLGGRNLNPLEFVLAGDDSQVARQATELRLRAQDAMVDAAHGPAAMAPAEVAAVSAILESIYCGEDRSR